MRIGFLPSTLLALGLCAAFALGAAPPAFAGGGWRNDLNAGFAAARAADRPLLVHVSATWCPPCRQMEPVLRSAPISALLRDEAIGVHLDFDRNKADAQRLGVRGLPADVLLAPDGRVLGQMSGFKQPADYARRVRAVAAQYVSVKTKPRPVRGSTPSRAVAPTPRPAVPPHEALDFRPQVLDDRFAKKQDPSWSMDNPPGLAAPDPEPEHGPGLGRIAPIPSESRSGGGAFGDSNRTPAANTYGDHPDPFGPRPTSDPLAPAVPDVEPDRESRRPVAGTPRVARRPSRKLLGMRGFCPVTLHEQRDWVRGARDFQWEHQGITYFLANEKAFDKFYERAERYAPKLLGCDPVLYRDEGRAVPGSTKYAAIWRDDLFLFTSAATRKTFHADPSRYANGRQVLLIDEIEGVGRY